MSYEMLSHEGPDNTVVFVCDRDPVSGGYRSAGIHVTIYPNDGSPELTATLPANIAEELAANIEQVAREYRKQCAAPAPATCACTGGPRDADCDDCPDDGAQGEGEES